MPGDRFSSAQELSEGHKVERTTAGRVHGTLISLGLIEHRAGIGTFVLGPAAGTGNGGVPAALRPAAEGAVRAFDEWTSRSKPQALAEAMDVLRDALGAGSPRPDSSSSMSARLACGRTGPPWSVTTTAT